MMSLHPRVVHRRRATITALPLYYSEHLLKKVTREKDFKQYYAELRGATLFLYTDDTQDTYVEKLDLEQLKSMELESPYQRKASTIFILTLQKEEVQLKMDNPDTGEEWRGYILTVVRKEIPSKLQLLPGQMFRLQEVLAEERKRNIPALHQMPPPLPPLPPRPSFLLSSSSKDIPECFFNVTRQEAEQMLEANPEYGGIILRPSTLANNYALTLRHPTSSEPVIKNYRLTTTNSGFVIELDNPVTVSSLSDALKYVIEKTEYRLYPYMESQPYDTRIEVSPPPKHVSITSPTTKTIPKAHVAPMQQSQPKEALRSTPAKPGEGEYVVPHDDRPDDPNLKLVQLDGELQRILKLQSENIYTANGDEKVTS